jgi:hypothetical protein
MSLGLPQSSSRVWSPRSDSSADSQLPMIDVHSGINSSSQPLVGTSLQIWQPQAQADDDGTDNQTQMFRIDPREGFFHAMLSYRVNPDQDFVTKIHDKVHLLGPVVRSSQTHEAPSLKSNLDTHPWPAAFRRDKSVCNSGIRLFQDSFCLKDGRAWEGDGGSQSGGFVGALKLSVVFAPLFSANVDQDGRVLPVGSVGQMIDLKNGDKQDNVLLELILARELHEQSKRLSKSALFPCSQILPLFHSKAVWDAAKELPKQPSAITNAKALEIMRSMGTPDSNISKELRNCTLTVADVWSFYAQFQGIMLHERGSEKYQIEAAANAIIQSINESVSNFKFHDLDMNYAQMYELFDFLSTLNMANYAKILACHKITNVFELSRLNTEEDSVVKLIAEHALQGSDSTLAAELFKLRSAIAAAKTNRFSKSLNDRFRDFIDEDASLATLSQSASVLDIGLSKPIGLAVVFLLFLGFAINSSVQLSAHDSLDSGMIYFPNSTAKRDVYYSCLLVFSVLMCIAVVIAHFRSPRQGRYAMSFALFYLSCVCAWTLAVSFRSAAENDCQDCANVNKLVSAQNSVALQIVNQPWIGVPIAVASVTMLLRQDVFVQLSITATVIFNSVPGFVFLVYFRSFQDIQATAYFRNAIAILVVYGTLKLLLYIGNRRAKQIYAINEKKTLQVYETLRSKFKHSKGFCDIGGVSSRSASNNLSSALNVSEFWGQELFGEGSIYQLHSSFESLVRDAEFINYPFQEWVSSWLTGGPHADKIKKHLFHGPNGVDTAFINLSKHAVECVKLQAALNCVLDEDVSDPSNPDAPLLARSGDTLAKDLLHKLQSAGVKEVTVVSSNAAIRGMHKRGPVKHVDRAIAKVRCYPVFPLHHVFHCFLQAYRSYGGKFVRLTDVVRCALVLETPDDITRLMQVSQSEHEMHLSC